MEGTSSSPAAEVVEPPKADSSNRLRLFLKLIRPKQWSKNLIVFAPLLFAQKFHVGHLFVNVAACFVAFCLASSCIYILNDVRDRQADQAHPTKKNRPLASGAVSVSSALVLCVLLGLAALVLSFLIRPTLCIVVAVYIALMVLYSLTLKHYVLLDVFSIASGFVIRAVGGAVAAHVPASGWFLLCTSFGALFLALEKRRQELKLLRGEAEGHRKALNSYSLEILNRMEGIVVPSLLTCYALYAFQSYHGQLMLLTVPFVVYGIMRYQVLSVRSSFTGTPEEVLLKDRPIQVAIFCWVLTAAAVVYDVIPGALDFVSRTADHLSPFSF